MAILLLSTSVSVLVNFCGSSSLAVSFLLLISLLEKGFSSGLTSVMAMATGGDSGSTSGVTADQLKELMASMRQGIRDEMSSMKHELATEREAADEKLVKRLKLEKALVFKKENERQYRRNEEV